MKTLTAISISLIMSIQMISDTQIKPITEHEAILIKDVNCEGMFEAAVCLIKRFEGWHSYKCMPYVGYGHRLLKTDNHLSLPITEAQGDSLLRTDLKKRMKLVKGNFKAKLLLGMLSYNVGQSRVLGSNTRPMSKVAEILLSGKEFNISELKAEYVSWRKWNGKIVKSIERRREAEFKLIFN